MVDSDVQITSATSLGDESLDTLSGHFLLSILFEGGKFDNTTDVERSVNLGKLLEETSENNVLERLDVTGGLGGLLEGGEDGLDLGGDGKRVEVDFENVVELTKFRADSLEDVTVELEDQVELEFRRQTQEENFDEQHQ